MSIDRNEGSGIGDRLLMERFAAVFDEIREGAVEREKERRLAHHAVTLLRESGFGAVRLPRRQGGLGASLPQLFRLLAALGEADSNLPQIWRAHCAFVEQRLAALDPIAGDPWLDLVADGAMFGAAMAERTEGTDTTATLTRDGDRLRLDGMKYYSTGTIYASWIVAVARDGRERVAVAVPASAPGVAIDDDWDGFGQRLTGSGTTRFADVAVEERQILRRFPIGELPTEDYMLAFYQTVHLATLSGIGRAVLRDAVAFVRVKTRTFGVPGVSSPRHDPLVQRVVGRLSAVSLTLDALVDAVAARMQLAQDGLEGGRPDKALCETANIAAFEAQQTAIDLVLQAAGLLFEVGGASATSEDGRLDRHWRNARVLASHNPAIQRERMIGDFRLNGTELGAVWKEAFKERSSAGDANA